MKVKTKKLKENNECLIKDESGEDYMCPANAFIVTEGETLPPEEKWEGF